MIFTRAVVVAVVAVAGVWPALHVALVGLVVGLVVLACVIVVGRELGSVVHVDVRLPTGKTTG